MKNKKQKKHGKGNKAEKKARKAAATNGSLFRPGSIVAKLYDRLSNEKVWTMGALFKGIETSDRQRLISDLRARSRKQFKIVRPEAGAVQLLRS